MIAAVPMDHGLLLAGLLFLVGLVGLLVRRNLLFTLMSLEVMLNATVLAFVVGGARWGAADGQVMAVFVLCVTAAEVAVALALLLGLRRELGSISRDDMTRLRG